MKEDINVNNLGQTGKNLKNLLNLKVVFKNFKMNQLLGIFYSVSIVGLAINCKELAFEEGIVLKAISPWVMSFIKNLDGVSADSGDSSGTSILGIVVLIVVTTFTSVIKNEEGI